MNSKIISVICLTLVTSAAFGLFGCHTGQTGSGESLNAHRDVQFSVNDEGGTLPDVEAPDNNCPDENCSNADCPDENLPHKDCPNGNCPDDERPKPPRHRRGRGKRRTHEDNKRTPDNKPTVRKPLKPIPEPTPLPAPDKGGTTDQPNIK